MSQKYFSLAIALISMAYFCQVNANNCANLPGLDPTENKIVGNWSLREISLLEGLAKNFLDLTCGNVTFGTDNTLSYGKTQQLKSEFLKESKEYKIPQTAKDSKDFVVKIVQVENGTALLCGYQGTEPSFFVILSKTNTENAIEIAAIKKNVTHDFFKIEDKKIECDKKDNVTPSTTSATITKPSTTTNATTTSEATTTTTAKTPSSTLAPKLKCENIHGLKVNSSDIDGNWYSLKVSASDGFSKFFENITCAFANFTVKNTTIIGHSKVLKNTTVYEEKFNAILNNVSALNEYHLYRNGANTTSESVKFIQVNKNLTLVCSYKANEQSYFEILGKDNKYNQTDLASMVTSAQSFELPKDWKNIPQNESACSAHGSSGDRKLPGLLTSLIVMYSIINYISN